MRALAVLVVLVAHVVTHSGGTEWWPATQFERFVLGPFAVIQWSGWLGVCLFFFVSGYVISHVAGSESRTEFALKRLLRIYPPLVAAVLYTAGVLWLRHLAGDATADAAPGLARIVLASTLVGYVTVPQQIVLAAAWTLVVEMLFYAAIWLLLPALRRRPWVASALVLAFTNLAIHEGRHHGPSVFLATVSIVYLPLLVLGQLLWARAEERCGWPAFAVLSLLAWVSFVRGLEVVYPGFLEPTSSYGVSVALAYGVFVIALLGRDHLRSWRPASLVAERSYGLYLVHGPTIMLANWLLGDRAFELRLAAVLIVTFATAEIVLRWVERPSRALARRWSA